MFTLRNFLDQLRAQDPEQLLTVPDPLNPAAFECTAVLQHLENRNRYPLVYFERPLNLLGEPSAFPLVSNVFASRERCALALGLDPADCNLPLSLEYARREDQMIAPTVIPRDEAPVKAVTHTGAAVNLDRFPIVRHHEMDPAPYVDMTPFMQDPETGAYNGAFLRMMYKGPNRLGLHMSPRHNWQIVRKNEERGRGTPVVVVIGHHPAFYLGCLNVSPFGQDDYHKVGAIMGESLRLTPSETWGSEILVPADAEIILEGEVLPGERDVEGPFGEFPGTYGPQRVRWVVEVKAVTHRADAIYQDVFVGHRSNWIMGAIPKEGSLYNRIKGVIPTVKGVHLPLSGVGRYHCYISIDKKVDGESKQAAFIAMGDCDFVKHVVVVDGDIDPFDEEKVWWSVATRVQADQDVDVIKNVKGSTLDPSQIDDIMTAKMIIDATRPVGRPFASRIKVPDDAMERVDISRYLPDDDR